MKTCDHLHNICPSMEEEVKYELLGIYWHNVYEFFHYSYIVTFVLSVIAVGLFFIRNLPIWWFVVLFGFSVSSICMKILADKFSSNYFTKMHLRSIVALLDTQNNKTIELLNKMIKNKEINLTSEDIEWYYSCALDRDYASARYQNIEKIIQSVINAKIDAEITDPEQIRRTTDEIQRIICTEDERRRKTVLCTIIGNYAIHVCILDSLIYLLT